LSFSSFAASAAAFTRFSLQLFRFQSFSFSFLVVLLLNLLLASTLPAFSSNQVANLASACS
jgi:hypothetical protein